MTSIEFTIDTIYCWDWYRGHKRHAVLAESQWRPNRLRHIHPSLRYCFDPLESFWSVNHEASVYGGYEHPLVHVSYRTQNASERDKVWADVTMHRHNYCLCTPPTLRFSCTMSDMRKDLSLFWKSANMVQDGTVDNNSKSKYIKANSARDFCEKNLE